MRITAVTGIIYHQPVVHRAHIPEWFRKTKSSHTTLLVKVETDSGLVGWGEGFGHYGMAPATREALQGLVGPRAVGEAVEDEGLTQRLSDLLYANSASGPVAYALSGLDIALWDLRGKVAGKPLHALLSDPLRHPRGGGDPGAARSSNAGALGSRLRGNDENLTRTASLRAYASFTRYGDAEVVRAEAKEALARGYGAIKLHEVRPAEIEAGLEASRAAGIPLMVDANCHWSVAEATAIAQRFPDLALLEEPIWPPENHAGLALLRQRARVPVAAGECAPSLADFERMLRNRAVDIAQPSVTKIGGIGAMRRIIALAQELGIQVQPHSPYYGPGLVATLHVCAALAPQAWVEHLFYDFATGPFGSAVVPQGGHFIVPDGPGLGIEPDARVLQELSAP